jgi:hypothetical protein
LQTGRRHAWVRAGAAPKSDNRVQAFWSAPAPAFLATDPQSIVDVLSRHQIHHFRTNEAEQLTAWHEAILALQSALETLGPAAVSWHVLLEYPMLRLGMRIDAILLTDRAILVLEFKRSQLDLNAFRQVEDYALNLRDFHDASRAHPIVPILISNNADATRNTRPLFWHALADVHQTTPQQLASVLAYINRQIGPPGSPLSATKWCAGAYRPVPTIIEAACMTYSRHGVEDIKQSRADSTNLGATISAIRNALASAQQNNEKIAIFVTGIPGAGKTLCGLTAAFAGDEAQATFLTGNPTLVHVLREALLRDATDNRSSRRATAHKIKSKIQRLPDFRNEYVQHPAAISPERIAIIDEAQRCWSRDYAIRKTLDKPVRLTDSEPGHLLDILARHEGFAAIICLVGSGQEIHDGEGGLAEWGTALATRPAWRTLAPPDLFGITDARWRLPASNTTQREPLLHLQTSVRHIRSVHANDWVDAMLNGDSSTAHTIASKCDPLPFTVTRNLATARAALRQSARGKRRAGMVASSEAKRLRAEGFGAELPHMDANAVAHWFLDHYPNDIRASDALELIATEFSIQGLELDYVLLGWDADLVREPNKIPWQPRTLRGTKWQLVHKAEASANHLNTYRVLLTRARYETIIYVPRGDAEDTTRPPHLYNDIITFLRSCGVTELENASAAARTSEKLEAVLI